MTATPFYVYALIDPRDWSVFYIGKGTNRRMYAHEHDVRRGKVHNAAKTERIKEILAAGLRVAYKVMSRHATDEEAYAEERAQIALHSGLTNANAGGAGALSGLSGGAGHSWAALLRAAEGRLRRMKPYLDWLNEGARTDADSALYHLVKRSTHQLANIARRHLGLQEAPCPT